MCLLESSKEIVVAELPPNSFFLNGNFGSVCLKPTTAVGFTGITESTGKKTPAPEESVPKRDEQSRFFSISDFINKILKRKDENQER